MILDPTPMLYDKAVHSKLQEFLKEVKKIEDAEKNN